MQGSKFDPQHHIEREEEEGRGSIHDLCDNIKVTNKSILGVQEGEDRDKETKKNLEK